MTQHNQGYYEKTSVNSALRRFAELEKARAEDKAQAEAAELAKQRAERVSGFDGRCQVCMQLPAMCSGTSRPPAMFKRKTGPSIPNGLPEYVCERHDIVRDRRYYERYNHRRRLARRTAENYPALHIIRRLRRLLEF